MNTTLKIALTTCALVVIANASQAQTNPTNAYWDGVNVPMAEVEPGVFAIYSGDTNQDGGIDALDMNIVESDAGIFAFGYNSSDINGDGATDALDMNIVEINTQLFLFTARPY